MVCHELKISLSNNIVEEIEKYKEVTHKRSIEEAVTELIKYALTLPLYYKNFDWDRAENEADKQIASGKTKSFNTIDDFISDLRR